MLKKLFKKKTYTYHISYMTGAGNLGYSKLENCKSKHGIRTAELELAVQKIAEDSKVEPNAVVVIGCFRVVD